MPLVTISPSMFRLRNLVGPDSNQLEAEIAPREPPFQPTHVYECRQEKGENLAELPLNTSGNEVVNNHFTFFFPPLPSIPRLIWILAEARFGLWTRRPSTSSFSALSYMAPTALYCMTTFNGQDFNVVDMVGWQPATLPSNNPSGASAPKSRCNPMHVDNGVTNNKTWFVSIQVPNTPARIYDPWHTQDDPKGMLQLTVARQFSNSSGRSPLQLDGTVVWLGYPRTVLDNAAWYAQIAGYPRNYSAPFMLPTAYSA